MPSDTTNLLTSWSFTDTTNWWSDATNAPVSFTNLSSSSLGNGTALVVDHTNAAWLRYKIYENDGHTNLTVNRGTVLFWFAPHWSGTNQNGTGPGESGRLIEVGSYTTNAAYGWWSLYVDPEGANLYFSAQTNDGSGVTFLSAPLAWTTNHWCHVALTYSSSNSALYLDGALVTNGLPVTNWPPADVLTNGFMIGSDGDTGWAQARGLFDDVATYDAPLAAETINGIYQSQSAIYFLNPENFANFGSAPFTPQYEPAFRAITGAGYLNWVSTNSNCAENENVWMTNVTANATANSTRVTFTIAGGSNDVAYDVFATAAFQSPMTNTVWAWMGQGYHCNTYTISNLPPTAVYLIVGNALDSDSDGLTDAFERLVSLTDPQNSDTDGDGVLDGWEVVSGTDPNPVVFRTLFNKLRVNGDTATGTVTVLRGVPGQIAVLVDNTNLASASWTAYHSTFTANLGSTNGPHEVLIGLKGRAETSKAMWTGYRLTRDTVAPSIAVTNLSAVVYRPTIQLQGYVDEGVRAFGTT